MKVKFSNANDLCLLANVNGANNVEERGNFFAELGLLLNEHVGPMMVGGEFNATFI